MSLAAFGLGLVAVFAAAVGVGAAVGPVGPPAEESTAPAVHHPAVPEDPAAPAGGHPGHPDPEQEHR